VHEVHESIMVVVVVSTLGRIHRKLKVVGAQPEHKQQQQQQQQQQ
jgi:hypothetical protein